MGSHTCLYYESEENLLELVSSFFEQGFRTNDLCLYEGRRDVELGVLLKELECDSKGAAIVLFADNLFEVSLKIFEEGSTILPELL